MGNTLSGPPKPAPERCLPRQGRRNPAPQQTKINLTRKLGLARDVASVDTSRHLRFPAVPGMHQVEVIVYRPVVVVGPRRSARIPAQRVLDPCFLRTTDVGGHLRSIGHLGWETGEAARAAYREDKQRLGLVGPAELPAGYTYVSPHPRRQSTRPLDPRGDSF